MGIIMLLGISNTANLLSGIFTYRYNGLKRNKAKTLEDFLLHPIFPKGQI